MAKSASQILWNLLCLQTVSALQEFTLIHSESLSQRPIATIDMGSNSFHLLVADWQQGSLRPQYAAVERVQTALLMDGNQLTPAAQDRVIACLRRFRHLAEERGCKRIVAVGTSALRQASNAASLLQMAEAELGWPVKVLSGDDEARLIYQAVATQHPNPGARTLVLDIGGGSTEVVLGCAGQIEDLASLSLGCVSSLKRHFADGQLNRESFDQCVQDAAQVLAPMAGRFHVAPDIEVVGCSGTALAIASVLGVQVVQAAQLPALRDRILADFCTVESVSFAGLDANRCSLLVPGLALLMALFDSFGIHQMATAQVALREGVAIAWYLGDAEVNRDLSPGIAI
jgi:exopolyphosphatase/guanosine-5'-triphosphate,3'-diphosphate pyrophosphatase